MQDLLQDPRVGHEALAVGDAALQQVLRVDFVRVRGPDKGHRDVRVDEDHRTSPPR